jgi:hypothetical protein
MVETVDNGRRRIVQRADILDSQNELGEGELLRERIFMKLVHHDCLLLRLQLHKT